MPLKAANPATISRKVWVWMNSVDGVLDPQQAFDGTVKYVHPDGDIAVEVTTHTGAHIFLEKIELHDPSDNVNTPNHHAVAVLDSPYATWMPYQKKQQDAASEQASQVTITKVTP